MNIKCIIFLYEMYYFSRPFKLFLGGYNLNDIIFKNDHQEKYTWKTVKTQAENKRKLNLKA